MTAPEKIGAFFDVDGTLVRSPSLEWRFVAFLLAREELSTYDIGRWAVQFAKTIVADPRSATLGNKRYLSGLRVPLAADWEQSLVGHTPPCYTAALESMRWHWSEGHRVFFISGTLDCLANAMARQLPGPVDVSATQLEVERGCWTGQIVGAHLSGEEKGRAVRNLAARFGLSLWDSYAYGNSISDLPMLDSVGHRVAVNPAARLRRIAFGEGWPICDWRLATRARLCHVKPAARQMR